MQAFAAIARASEDEARGRPGDAAAGRGDVDVAVQQVRPKDGAARRLDRRGALSRAALQRFDDLVEEEQYELQIVFDVVATHRQRWSVRTARGATRYT